MGKLSKEFGPQPIRIGSLHIACAATVEFAVNAQEKLFLLAALQTEEEIIATLMLV